MFKAQSIPEQCDSPVATAADITKMFRVHGTGANFSQHKRKNVPQTEQKEATSYRIKFIVKVHHHWAPWRTPLLKEKKAKPRLDFADAY